MFFPSAQTLGLGKGIPVSNALSAAFVWFGEEAFLAALKKKRSPKSVIQLLQHFLEGNGGLLYPPDLGSRVTAIARDMSHVSDAWLQHRSDWILAVLNNINLVAEVHFQDICELLDPRFSFVEIVLDPPRMESFIVESIRALASVEPTQGREAVRGAASLLRVLRSRINLAQLINSLSVTNALFALQQLAIRSAQIDPGVEFEWRNQIQVFITNTYQNFLRPNSRAKST